MALVTGQGTGTGSAAALSATGTTLQYLEIRNTHASVTLYVGAAGVLTTTGHAIPFGQTHRIERSADPAEVYVVGNTATFTWAGAK